MPQAVWNGTVIAASDETVVVEGNHYFPADSVHREFLRESNTHTHCPWKGDASYCHLVVDGRQNTDAVWFYPEPLPAAAEIADHYAFWNGVEIR